MPIKRVEVNKFRVFADGLSVDFCSGVNVLMGDNGTGKTTLMKAMYYSPKYENLQNETLNVLINLLVVLHGKFQVENMIYIPEKDILEHAKGLLPFIEQKQTGFEQIYKDVLIAAQDVPTQEQTKTQKSIGKRIFDLIGGVVEWNQGEGSFYTIKTDGSRIPFANEASAYKKLGFLGLMVSSGQLSPNSILFWDEPENSLNRELVPELVDILLELAESGVQIFIASHDYDIVRYFDVRKNKNIPVMFCNLIKTDDGGITCKTSSEYHTLPNNHLERAGENLFKAITADALEIDK
ncbi:MAG: AAA family ATPase [Defluviitaleaceae bacterium]|nr:AAA family ATPase [Defluviitaleaceae bacterium]